ncbi:MAG: murein biosynthesis integral membrane protein MurJ [Caldilineaceae bacterium]|nr:murein biosynthesis integral membrane protein MurJ [Caldilineaceae bacterium]
MTRTRHLVRSSLFVIVIFGLNKVTGFGKLLLMTSIFGTGPDADAYAAANQLPELFLAMLTGGALAAALIPVYSAYLSRRESDHAQELSNTVLTLTLIVVGSICTLAALAAPWLIRVLLLPNFDPAQQALTADLMQIILFSSILISVGSVFTSLLHAHQHFLAPAWATVAIDMGQIIGIVLLAPFWGIYGAAWGTVIGAALLVAVQIPALIRHRIGFRLRLALRLRGVWELARLMWPRVITLGVFQATDLVFIRLASQLPTGSISAYFYAYLAMVAMPKSLFGTAISNVIFPTLAEQYNSGSDARLKETVTQGLRATWLLILPSAVGLLALGQPAVAFLFQRGAFDEGSTALVYALMAILSLRLIGDASQDILSLVFYARHNTITPMWLNLGWMVLNVTLSFLLVGSFGIFGLAWAASLASLTLALTLYLISRWVGNGLDDTVLTSTLRRLLLACVGMGGVIFALHQLSLPTLLFLVLGIGGGGATFLALYLLLGGRELLGVADLLRRTDR